MLRWLPTTVAERAGTEVLMMPSIKASLDVDWSDPEEKSRALRILVEQLDDLEQWIERNVPEHAQAEVAPHLATLHQIRVQDLEQTTQGPRILHGVAHDRRVSIEDAEMRHGRKSSSYAFNGYKRHIATDLDTKLIVAVAITAANLPEMTAMPVLQDDFEHQLITVGELFIDRGYIASDFVDHVLANHGGDLPPVAILEPRTVCQGRLRHQYPRPHHYVPTGADAALRIRNNSELRRPDVSRVTAANEMHKGGGPWTPGPHRPRRSTPTTASASGRHTTWP